MIIIVITMIIIVVIIIRCSIHLLVGQILDRLLQVTDGLLQLLYLRLLGVVVPGFELVVFRSCSTMSCLFVAEKLIVYQYF